MDVFGSADKHVCVLTLPYPLLVFAVSDLVGGHGEEHGGVESGHHLLPAPPHLHQPYQLQVSSKPSSMSVWESGG